MQRELPRRQMDQSLLNGSLLVELVGVEGSEAVDEMDDVVEEELDGLSCDGGVISASRNSAMPSTAASRSRTERHV